MGDDAFDPPFDLIDLGIENSLQVIIQGLDISRDSLLLSRLIPTRPIIDLWWPNFELRLI